MSLSVKILIFYTCILVYKFCPFYSSFSNHMLQQNLMSKSLFSLPIHLILIGPINITRTLALALALAHPMISYYSIFPPRHQTNTTTDSISSYSFHSSSLVSVSSFHGTLWLSAPSILHSLCFPLFVSRSQKASCWCTQTEQQG